MTNKPRVELIYADSNAPWKATQNSAAYDCFVHSCTSLGDGYFKYGLGFKLHLPSDLCAFLFPRSSVHKTRAMLANSVGLIDSDYRDEVCAIFKSQDGHPPYNYGDRCCQLMVLPTGIKIEGCEESSEERTGGFGSTNK